MRILDKCCSPGCWKDHYVLCCKVLDHSCEMGSRADFYMCGVCYL